MQLWGFLEEAEESKKTIDSRIKKIVGRLVKQEMVKLLTHLMTENSKTCSTVQIFIAIYTVH